MTKANSADPLFSFADALFSRLEHWEISALEQFLATPSEVPADKALEAMIGQTHEWAHANGWYITPEEAACTVHRVILVSEIRGAWHDHHAAVFSRLEARTAKQAENRRNAPEGSPASFGYEPYAVIENGQPQRGKRNADLSVRLG
jgi:hypothetical protein